LEGSINKMGKLIHTRACRQLSQIVALAR
jgi:hypothetical protein